MQTPTVPELLDKYEYESFVTRTFFQYMGFRHSSLEHHSSKDYGNYRFDIDTIHEICTENTSDVRVQINPKAPKKVVIDLITAILNCVTQKKVDDWSQLCDYSDLKEDRLCMLARFLGKHHVTEEEMDELTNGSLIDYDRPGDL